MRRQAGFTLMELMVAMTLTLVITGAAFSTFHDGLRLTEATTSVLDLDQNLRSGMNLITQDLLQAGEGIPTGGIPIPSGTGARPIRRPSPPGVAYTFPTNWVVLPAVSPGSNLGPAINGRLTDMVTILMADATLRLDQSPLSAIAPDGSSMTVDQGTPITDPASGIKPGDLIMFTNALGNALQHVTRADGSQTVFFEAGDSLDLNQRGAPQGTILRLQSSPGQYPPTTATRVQMITYYIDVSTVPAEPRLVRQVNATPGRAMALGFEDLQFTFDVVDGVTNPAGVDAPVPPNSPHEIRKVNLAAAGRSLEARQHGQQFFRTSLSTQVSLRSLSYVDRYR